MFKLFVNEMADQNVIFYRIEIDLNQGGTFYQVI